MSGQPTDTRQDTVTQIWERILRDKEQRRKELAQLPFAEKIQILERLRARAAIFAKGRK